MIRKSYWAALAAASLFTAPALAESHFYADVTGGTLGIGPELGYRMSDNFGVRANATFLGISHGYDSDDTHYQGHIALKSGGAMVDYYPFGGGFRLSAGARINGNNGHVIARPTGPIEIGDGSYTAPANSFIRGDVDVKNFAPALTLGYGASNHRGFLWGLEAGALFEGTIHVKSFTTNIPGVKTADLEAERASIQHDVDTFKVYPIVQLILGWRF